MALCAWTGLAAVLCACAGVAALRTRAGLAGLPALVTCVMRALAGRAWAFGAGVALRVPRMALPVCAEAAPARAHE